MMKKLTVFASVSITAIVGLLLAILTASANQALVGPKAQQSAPTLISYQGYLSDVEGQPISGAVSLTFGLYDTSSGGDPLWQETQDSVPVDNGYFAVLLGSVAPLNATHFDEPTRYLQVGVSSGSGLVELPRQQLAAVPYALQAQQAAVAPWSGLTDVPSGFADGIDDGADYARVIVVAKSGGDFSNVQAAINSVTDASADAPHLVWVAPGTYSETVTMKPYVHLQGAGQEATIITSTVGASNADMPTEGTLVLAAYTSLRDLTVGNGGTGDDKAVVALLAPDGVTETLVTDVTARAQGESSHNHAIHLSGYISDTSVTLQDVTALAESSLSGHSTNTGLSNRAVVLVYGGSFTGRGGGYAHGISNHYGLSIMYNVTALGEGNNNDANWGLQNTAAAVLRGGFFTGRGGSRAYGISAGGTKSTLDAENVIALGENSDRENYGLYNSIGMATLRGGSFTGRGGDEAYGLYNSRHYSGITATLEADNVVALGKDSSDENYGLFNSDDADATLRGGSFTGSGGTFAYGIRNQNNGSTLAASGVIALGKDSDTENYGLLNEDAAVVTLHGGSFTGRGSLSFGICNQNENSTLTAFDVTALGEGGSTYIYGLSSQDYAKTDLYGGSFIALGGSDTRGIHNRDNANLTAVGVTALGADGSNANYGLYNLYDASADVTQSTLDGASNSARRDSGSLGVSNSRLVGGGVNGTVTCTAVSRNTTFNASGCP